MAGIEVVSVELQKCQDALPQWTEALSRCIGRIPLSLRNQEVTRCQAAGQRFSGRIEFANLGDIVLSKVSTTPHHFRRSLGTLAPTLPIPVLLCIQLSGNCRFDQHGHSCTLAPGDWCLIDTLHPFDSWSFGTRVEAFLLTLERPRNPDLSGLLERGVARRFNGTTGTPRVLQSAVTDVFGQLTGITSSSRRSLQYAITEIAWAALREQLQNAGPVRRQDRQCVRLKAYIESQLADPELSVCSIAQACGVSVRSVHRAFAGDPAGSVSNYIWMRRLNHCAAVLRDPKQAYRPVGSLCFSWGFKSSSHFTRLFKQQFGVAPSAYRAASSDDSAAAGSSRSFCRDLSPLREFEQCG